MLKSAEISLPCTLVPRLDHSLGPLMETFCYGQQTDLDFSGQDPSQEQLQQVYEAKTGVVFQFAAELGAFVGGADAAGQAYVNAFGRKLGWAYQVVDDRLDFSGTSPATEQC